MANHLFLPLVVPMISAALSVMLGRWSNLSRMIALVAGLFNLGYSSWLLWLVQATGRQVTQGSSWIAPFGISLVADLMSAVMLFLAALLMFCTIIYSLLTMEPEYEQFFYYPLLLLLLLGVSGAFLTGDLFNLYVWFEVLLISSFGLVTIGGSRAQLTGGLKYVALNLIGSTMFLIGSGLIYGLVGTLNMAHIGERLITQNAPGLSTVIATLFLFAFGSKAALAPLFFWLPESYHTPPAAVSAIFSALMTKVGVYALYRVFGTVLPGELVRLAPIILVLGGLTMVLGVLGALNQHEIRRVLSFTIISEIGFVAMGLGFASVAGLAAGLLFTAHMMIVKTALFFLAGAAEQVSGTGDMRRMGGLARREPALATLWFLGMIALAGIPPMSGFFGKLALLQAGVRQGHYLISGLAVLVSLFIFLAILKIWHEVFWKKPVEDLSQRPRLAPALLIPGALLVILSVVIGIGAGPVSELSTQAGTEILNLPGYINSVCGSAGCDAITSQKTK